MSYRAVEHYKKPKAPKKRFCSETNKLKLTSEYAARAELENCWRSMRGKHMPIRFYVCHFCEEYHLTSQPLREQRTR
jgi:hypothetical protein